MHQTKKGNQWYFGMKVHIGVDSRTGLAHSARVTPANVHDSRSCRTCCTVTRPGCMATAPTGAEGADRRQGAASQGLHQPARPRKTTLTSPRERRTATSRASAPASNMCSPWSSGSWVFSKGTLSRAGYDDVRLRGTCAGQHLSRSKAVDGTGASVMRQCGPKAAKNALRAPSKGRN